MPTEGSSAGSAGLEHIFAGETSLDFDRCSISACNSKRGILLEYLAAPDILRSMYDQKSKGLFDVILIVENKEFFAHRAVLAGASPVFKAMFTGGFKEGQSLEYPQRVALPELKYSVCQHLLNFLYLGKIEVSCEEAALLMTFADRFQMLDLLARAERSLCENISIDNVIELYQLAVHFKLNNLMGDVIYFTAMSHDSVTLLKELPIEMMIHALECDALRKHPVSSSRFVARWVQSDEPRRGQFSDSLLQRVPFSLSLSRVKLGALGKSLVQLALHSKVARMRLETIFEMLGEQRPSNQEDRSSLFQLHQTLFPQQEW